MTGGRELSKLPEAPLSVFSKNPIESESAVFEPNMSNKLSQVKNEKASIDKENRIDENQQSLLNDKQTEIKEKIEYLKNKFINGDNDSEEKIPEEIKNQMIEYYDYFEKSLVFYTKHTDISLPLYAIVDSYFVEDALFIFMLHLLNPNKKKDIEFNDDLFTEIHNMRLLDYKKNAPEIYDKIKLSREIRGGGKIMYGGKIGSLRVRNYITEQKDDPILKDKVYINDTEDARSKLKNILSKDKADEIFKLIKKWIYGIINSLHSDNNFVIVDNDTDEDIKTKIIEKFLYYDHCIYRKTVKSHTAELRKYIFNIKKSSSWSKEPNPRKFNRSISDYNRTIDKICSLIVNKLHKEYLVPDYLQNLVSPTTYISNNSSRETTEKSLSPEGKEYMNLLLKTIINGVKITSFNANDIDQRNPFFPLFKQEQNTINQIAASGNFSGDADQKILNELISSAPDNYTEIYNKYQLDKLLHPAGFREQPVKIINNAIPPKLKSTYASEEGNKYNITCPIPSIIDGQGSFGSCSNITPIKQNQSFLIRDEDDNYNFTMEIIYKKGKVMLNYSTFYNSYYLGEFNVDMVINNGKVNTLEAATSMENVINNITQLWDKVGNSSWDIFDSENRMNTGNANYPE